MTMAVRFIGASLMTLGLVAAFTLGRVTGPHAVATAQVPPTTGHFMCYRTKVATSASAAANVTDQFGSQTIKFYQADMLCAPAKKIPASFRPIKVAGAQDHLLCYHTQAPFINAQRRLANQLEKTAFNGLAPAYFCMPTNKSPG
jgi:hypothetical protein